MKQNKVDCLKGNVAIILAKTSVMGKVNCTQMYIKSYQIKLVHVPPFFVPSTMHSFCRLQEILYMSFFVFFKIKLRICVISGYMQHAETSYNLQKCYRRGVNRIVVCNLPVKFTVGL